MESEPVLLGPSLSPHFVGLLKQGDPAQPSSPEVRPGSTSEGSITHNEEPSLRKPFQISFKNLDGAVKDWKPRTLVNYGERLYRLTSVPTIPPKLHLLLRLDIPGCPLLISVTPVLLGELVPGHPLLSKIESPRDLVDKSQTSTAFLILTTSTSQSLI